MGKASWASPETGTWIDARAAWYVIGSDRRGGMGAPEPVPFSDREAAARFSESHGGSVAAYAELPPDYFLNVASASPGSGMQPKHEKMHE
jgi:copper chaperone NosL